MASYEKAGVTFAELYAKGYFDVIGRELAMSPTKINGETMPGATAASRDFWLVEHADRIMDTVAGLAFTGLVSTIPDASCVNAKGHATSRYYDRERYQGTIERAKEITGRFVHYAMTLQAHALDFREDMTEAELREWAAGVVSALQR